MVLYLKGSEFDVRTFFVVYEGFHGEDKWEQGFAVTPCILVRMMVVLKRAHSCGTFLISLSISSCEWTRPRVYQPSGTILPYFGKRMQVTYHLNLIVMDV